MESNIRSSEVTVSRNHWLKEGTVDNSSMKRAIVTIFLLRLLAFPYEGSHDGTYRVLPGTQLLTEDEVAEMLARMSKPLSCIASNQGSVVIISCAPVKSLDLTGWRNTQSFWLESFSTRITSLQKAGEVTSSVTIACGQGRTRLDLKEFLIWRSEYDLPSAGSIVESQQTINGRELVMRFLAESASPKIRGNVRRIGFSE